MEFTLPTQKTPARRKSPRKLVIYAPPKTGKTTVLSQLDSNLILDLEKGTHFLDSLSVDIKSLEDLYKYGEEIKKAGKPYKYISLDTITELESLCEEDAKRLYKQTPMGANFKGKSVLDLPNGGGYFYLRKSVEGWLSYIESLSDNIIIVAHLKDKFLTTKSGEEVQSKDLDLTGKIRNIVCAGADAIGYLYRDADGKLRISFTTTETVICGARPAHLAGQDFEFSWDKIYID